jgi:DNA-binding MarR family transcriptional regulator
MRGTNVTMLEELPLILVKAQYRLTELQIEHIKFLYTRTTYTKSDICVLVNIDTSTLDRIIRRNRWPLRQPNKRGVR